MINKLSPWVERHSLVLFFVITYAISWAIWIPIVLSAQGLVKWQIPYALYYCGSFGPMFSALIMTALTTRGAGVRKLLSRLVKWRVDLRYYAFAVLAPVGLFVIGVLVNRVIAGTWPDLKLLGEADYMPHLGIAGVLVLWFITFGLGEETGWRGFALPHLQRTRPAANAALILGIFWGCWHLPAFIFRDTYTEMGIIGFPMMLVSIVFASVVFAWLYNSTAGSLLLVTLFHIFFNWLSVSEAGGQYVAIIMTMPLILFSIYVVRNYGPENVAPIEKQIE
jgi:membrane protease YdiL (CAAX protease family)